MLGRGGRDGSIGRETWFAATRAHFKQEQCLIAALCTESLHGEKPKVTCAAGIGEK